MQVLNNILRYKSNNSYLRESIISLLVIFLTLIIALWWYRERMFHFDASFYLFELVQKNRFNFFHDRYISFFTQSLPLALHYFGFSLKTVARSYSASLPLAQLVILFFLFRWIKDGRYLMLFLLVILTSVRYRFFSPISETHFVLIFSFLYFLFAQRTALKYRWENTATLLAIFLASLSHPVAIVPVLALWGITVITREKAQLPQRIYELVAIVIFFGWRFWLVAGNEYESGKLGVVKRLGSILSDLPDLLVTQMVFEYLTLWHLVQWIVFLIMTGWLLVKGKVIEALSGVGFSLMILVMVLVTYSYLDFRVYHMFEGYLSFISLGWMIPAYFLIRENASWKKLFLLMGVSLFTSFWSISEVKDYYSDRENYLTQVYKPWTDKGNKKLVMSRDVFPWRQLWYNWAVPYETLLMSASLERTNAVTLLVPDSEEKFELVQRELDYFFGPWESIPMEDLDTLYFSFPRQQYLNISDADLPSDFFQ